MSSDIASGVMARTRLPSSAEKRAQNERTRADALAESRRQQEEMMERARRDIAAEPLGVVEGAAALED